MHNVHLVAVGSVVAAFGALSCSFVADVPKAANILCATDADCPDGYDCRASVGRCIAGSVNDVDAPTIVASSIEPAIGSAGTDVALHITLNEPLAVAPIVVMETLGKQVEFAPDGPSTDAAALEYAFHARIAGDEGDGVYSVTAVLVDAAGNRALARAAGFTIDTVAPAPTAGAASVQPAQAREDTIVSVAVPMSEPLANGGRLVVVDPLGAAADIEIDATEIGASLVFTFVPAPAGVTELAANGPRVLSVVGAQDLAGNTAETAVEIGGIVVDTVAPALVADDGFTIVGDDHGGAGQDGVWSDALGAESVVACFDVDADAVTIDCRVRDIVVVATRDDLSCDAWSCVLDLPPPDVVGSFLLEIIASDAAGNTGTSALAGAVQIDTASPALVSAQFDDAAPPLGGLVTLTIAANEPVLQPGLVFQDDDLGALLTVAAPVGAGAAWTFTYRMPVSAVPATFTSAQVQSVTLRDTAGNQRVVDPAAGTDGVSITLNTARCVAGFHNGGDGSCVGNGTCSAGFHDGGSGNCLTSGSPLVCSVGFHDGGDGLECVDERTCQPDAIFLSDGTCIAPVFVERFEGAFDPAPWSASAAPVLAPALGADGGQALGRYGQDELLSLVLTGLPTHTEVEIHATLTTIGGWSGNTNEDRWQVRTGASAQFAAFFEVFASTFALFGLGNTQSFPTNLAGASGGPANLPMTGAREKHPFPDPDRFGVYDVVVRNSHVGPVLRADFVSTSALVGADIRWLLDDVRVYVLPLSSCGDGVCDLDETCDCFDCLFSPSCDADCRADPSQCCLDQCCLALVGYDEIAAQCTADCGLPAAPACIEACRRCTPDCGGDRRCDPTCGGNRCRSGCDLFGSCECLPQPICDEFSGCRDPLEIQCDPECGNDPNCLAQCPGNNHCDSNSCFVSSCDDTCPQFDPCDCNGFCFDVSCPGYDACICAGAC